MTTITGSAMMGTAGRKVARSALGRTPVWGAHGAMLLLGFDKFGQPEVADHNISALVHHDVSPPRYRGGRCCARACMPAPRESVRAHLRSTIAVWRAFRWRGRCPPEQSRQPWLVLAMCHILAQSFVSIHLTYNYTATQCLRAVGLHGEECAASTY
jgi:hypothetical protein